MIHLISLLGYILKGVARTAVARFLAHRPLGAWFMGLCGLFMLLGSGYSIVPFNQETFVPYLLIGAFLIAISVLLMMQQMPRSRKVLLILAPVMMLAGALFGYSGIVGDYDLAMNQFQHGSYESAKQLFQSLEGFRNSEEMIAECDNYTAYTNALEDLEDSPGYAYWAMRRLKGFAPADEMLATPAFQAAREQALLTGESVEFGRYYCDAKTAAVPETQPVKWEILARDGDRALLISRYVLDTRTFHDTKHPITWADSELRQWLNGEFLSLAFTAQEQSAIDLTTVDSRDGIPVQDRLFLMSYDEVCRYMPTDNHREAKGTPYVTGRYSTYGPSSWLLRRLGSAGSSAPCISHIGSLTTVDAAFEPAGVRPAMWVVLDPAFF